MNEEEYMRFLSELDFLRKFFSLEQKNQKLLRNLQEDPLLLKSPKEPKLDLPQKIDRNHWISQFWRFSNEVYLHYIIMCEIIA